MGSIFVSDDEFDHESFGIGLLQKRFGLIAVNMGGNRSK